METGGPMPSDAAAPTAPLPEEPLPEEPPQRRTMSRWNEWLLTPEVADQFTFEDGERIFEFSDRYSRTGWKPFDKIAQLQLQALFRSCFPVSLESTTTKVNCLNWTYDVKFDLFHKNRREFANAPDEAIGYQFSSHQRSTNSKRWIRLTPYKVADRT